MKRLSKSMAWLLVLAAGLAGCGGRHEAGSSLSSAPRPSERIALIGDSLAAGLFADTAFGADPRASGADYSQLQNFFTIMGNLKFIMVHKVYLLRAMQTYGDMNQMLGSHAQPYQSLLHAAIWSRGDGSRIVTESAIIASKVEPDSFARHINNYTNWSEREFSSIMIALGSNDICNSWQNADQFENNYRAALQHVTATFPGRNLYLVSPPHIPRLADDDIANARFFGVANMQCRDYFEIMACPAYRDSGRFYEFLARMKKVAGEYPDAKFVDISTERPWLSDFSTDCFHPSAAGHQRFAALLKDKF